MNHLNGVWVAASAVDSIIRSNNDDDLVMLRLDSGKIYELPNEIVSAFFPSLSNNERDAIAQAYFNNGWKGALTEAKSHVEHSTFSEFLVEQGFLPETEDEDVTTSVDGPGFNEDDLEIDPDQTPEQRIAQDLAFTAADGDLLDVLNDLGIHPVKDSGEPEKEATPEKSYSAGMVTMPLEGYQDELRGAYERGVEDGGKGGYENGVKEGRSQRDEEHAMAMTNTYNAGLVEGLDKGTKSGYAKGVVDGKIEGHNKGRAEGARDGYAKGTADATSTNRDDLVVERRTTKATIDMIVKEIHDKNGGTSPSSFATAYTVTRRLGFQIDGLPTEAFPIESDDTILGTDGEAVKAF